MVEDADYESSKEIILEWERNQPKEKKTKEKKKKSHISSLFIGAVLGGAFVAFLYNTPVTDSGIDYNGDGKLDERWFYIDDRIHKTELDRNFDGKVDFIFRFNRNAILTSSKSDEDFDGRFETENYFNKGSIAWSKSDIDGDGFFEYQINFIHGVLDTIEFIDKKTKRPIKIQKYGPIKLISAKLDTNGDGVFDKFYEYDEIEEIKK